MTLTTPIVITRSVKPFRASFKADTALIRVFHILKINYIFISLKHYKLYHYNTNTMNTAEVEKINKTVGVLETLQDALGPAIIIIENMMQQNQAMHQSLRMENERLKTEINEVREEKQKLKESEKARKAALRTQLNGREEDKSRVLAMQSEVNNIKEKLKVQIQKKTDALLEAKEARAEAVILKEELKEANEATRKTEMQLEASREIQKQIKDDAAARTAMMTEEQREMAKQTDTAQTAKRKDDVELEGLKLQVAELKQNMMILRNILENPNTAIDENTRKQLQEALKTSAPKSKMLSNKIKF